MGLRGPLSNAVEVVRPNEAITVPDPGIDLHPTLMGEWHEFWTSGVARTTDDVDISSLRRLFVYRDEWLRCAVALGMLPMDERVVAGSRNAEALRMHPFAERMKDLEKLILPLEDRFGLSPLSRARLGIEVGNATLTWAQVQQATTGGSPKRELPVAGTKELGA